MQTQDQPQHAPAAQAERPEHVDVLVIGAGQAGLAVGWHLREQGVRSFLLLDAGPEVGHVVAQPLGLAAAVHPRRVRRPARHAVPRPGRHVPDQGRGRGLPARLRRRVRAAGPPQHPRHPAHQDRRRRSTPTPRPAPSRARQVVIATGPFQTPVVPALGPPTSRPTSSSCTPRTTATPTSCPTARSWSSAPATPGCRSPPSSPPPGPSPSRSGPGRRCCRSGSSAATCSGG